MAFKTITLKGRGVRNEAVANEIITPGMLVELMSTGKVRKHAAAGAYAEKAFAVEDELQGKEIGDTYAAAALVQYEIFKPGDEVFSLLANGENVAIGDKLDSNGDGQLRKHLKESGTLGEAVPVATALEAVDMSDSSAADPSGRIAIRIL